MILLLIGAAITTSIVLFSGERPLKKLISLILEICFIVALLVNVILVNIEPAGYKKLDSLGYTTKEGYIETLEGKYYTDGSKYYFRNDSKCSWVPFLKPDYTEVDIDKDLVVDINMSYK